MATIRRLKSGAYQVIVRLKDHPIKTKTFPTKRDADAWAAITEGDIVSGRARGDAYAHRLSDLINEYRKLALPKLRTAKDRERHLAYWFEALGDVRLADITPKKIAGVLHHYAETPVAREIRTRGKVTTVERPRSEQTVRHLHVGLSALLDFARRDLHWIAHNPAQDTRMARVSPARIAWLKDDERDRLLAACRESANPDLYLVVLLALTSGARQAEIVNLRWSQIDWKQHCAWLTPEDTKTSEPRSMPLVPEVIAELKARTRILHVDLVFASPIKRDQPRNVRQAWCVARTRAGLPTFRFHDLRHSAATELLRAGVDSRVVATVLGQKSLAMMRRYAHVAPALVVDAATRAAEAVNRRRL